MSIKVLVADEDLDVHELIHDILRINFKQVTIDRALSMRSFMKKVGEAEKPYDLILLNPELDNEFSASMLDDVQKAFPAIMDSIVLLADTDAFAGSSSLRGRLPRVSKPYSLDLFGDVIKKICS